MEVASSVLRRFLHYVTCDTRSDESSASSPSTPGQLALLTQLEAELRALGARDVALDEYGNLMATIPATSSARGVPTIGFLAHVDTAPDLPGAAVRPLVHRGYDGRDLVLPDGPLVLRLAENPELSSQMGHDIVTASGGTLLGADDKAGVAEIMTAAEVLLQHPEIPHGPVRLAFTPDEEIGRGTAHFDVERFGAAFAYTLDGGECGELEVESFSADAMVVTFHGVNTHPGYARGRMVNAIRMAARFIEVLGGSSQTPETSGGMDGYLHAHALETSVERAVVRLLVRDFRAEGLREREALAERLAREVADRFGGRVELTVVEQYRNMREVLDRHPAVVERAVSAIRRAGLEVRMRPIRGGTDGSRLSWMGIPTPNLFAGQHNIHSRLEWTSAQDMAKAVAVIVELCQEWARPPR